MDSRYVVPLDRASTRTIDRTGGTWLHSSRTNPRKMRANNLRRTPTARAAQMRTLSEDIYDVTPVVLENIEAMGLDYLIPIGGDDTLSFSQTLHENGVPLIAIPKTMDNDVQGTEYCIGFSTAITRAKDAINRQRTTLGSHERIGAFRIFGRDAGFTALYTAFVTSARCLIPEATFDLDRLAGILAEDHANNPSHYAFVIAAEGAMRADSLGYQRIDFAAGDHRAHQRRCFGRDREAQRREARGEARKPEDAHRILGEGRRHMPQHARRKVVLATVRVDQRAVGGARDRVDGQVASLEVVLERDGAQLRDEATVARCDACARAAPARTPRACPGAGTPGTRGRPRESPRLRVQPASRRPRPSRARRRRDRAARPAPRRRPDRLPCMHGKRAHSGWRAGLRAGIALAGTALLQGCGAGSSAAGRARSHRTDVEPRATRQCDRTAPVAAGPAAAQLRAARDFASRELGLPDNASYRSWRTSTGRSSSGAWWRCRNSACAARVVFPGGGLTSATAVFRRARGARVRCATRTRGLRRLGRRRRRVLDAGAIRRSERQFDAARQYRRRDRHAVP